MDPSGKAFSPLGDRTCRTCGKSDTRGKEGPDDWHTLCAYCKSGNDYLFFCEACLEKHNVLHENERVVRH